MMVVMAVGETDREVRWAGLECNKNGKDEPFKKR